MVVDTMKGEFIKDEFERGEYSRIVELYFKDLMNKIIHYGYINQFKVKFRRNGFIIFFENNVYAYLKYFDSSIVFEFKKIEVHIDEAYLDDKYVDKDISELKLDMLMDMSAYMYLGNEITVYHYNFNDLIFHEI